MTEKPYVGPGEQSLKDYSTPVSLSEQKAVQVEKDNREFDITIIQWDTTVSVPKSRVRLGQGDIRSQYTLPVAVSYRNKLLGFIIIMTYEQVENCTYGILSVADAGVAREYLSFCNSGHFRPGSKTVQATITEAEEAVRTLLKYIGEDPTREGLLDTPRRVVKAWREMTTGYWGTADETARILSPVFNERTDEIVIVRNIPFVSCCEHHMLMYSGTCDVGYIPGANNVPRAAKPEDYTYRVVGLSKLTRLVDHFSRRLTLQERMSRQIADTIMDVLKPQGVGVIVRASHSCISCRGVMKHGTECVTSVMLGAFRNSPSARAEFMSLCKV